MPKKQKPKPIRCIVWTGREDKEVEGVLLDFIPTRSDPRKRHQNPKLFKSGRKWWLYYPNAPEHERNNGLTGDFKTRARAEAWYNKGGR